MGNEKLHRQALAALPSLIDQDKLRNWWLENLHNGKVVCCHCGQSLSDRARETFMEYKITSCVSCRKKVQFFQGTLVKGAKLPPEVIVVLMALLSAGVDARLVALSAGVSVTCVREWQKKINPGCDGETE